MKPPGQRHAIVTMTDDHFGDFVRDHWYASLRDHVDLSDIDVHVLDYGMTEAQRNSLTELGIGCHRAEKDGNVSNVRYRDLATLLEQHDYDQVLMSDGGDIIFQADIRPVMERDKGVLRAACHEYEVPFHEAIMFRSDFDDGRFREIATFLKNKPTVNGGVLLGPANRMKELWSRFNQLTDSFQQFGIDQFLLNYTLFHDGFVELESKYNYSIIARTTNYTVRNGVFLDEHGDPIPIVHNSGIYEHTRPIRNFGYGPLCNQRRLLVPFVLRTSYRLFNLFRPTTVAKKAEHMKGER